MLTYILYAALSRAACALPLNLRRGFEAISYEKNIALKLARVCGPGRKLAEYR